MDSENRNDSTDSGWLTIILIVVGTACLYIFTWPMPL
jgi:hypothetical protein